MCGPFKRLRTRAWPQLRDARFSFHFRCVRGLFQVQGQKNEFAVKLRCGFLHAQATTPRLKGSHLLCEAVVREVYSVT